MRAIKFTYWQDGKYYLGFLNDYPEYETQGLSKQELVKNLRDLLADFESDQVPHVRKVGSWPWQNRRAPSKCYYLPAACLFSEL